MKIFDYIKDIFSKRPSNNILRPSATDFAYGIGIGCMPFGEVIFRNCVELLTNMVNDVTLVKGKSTDIYTFAQFKRFFELHGKEMLNRYFYDGYVVMQIPTEGDPMSGFRLMSRKEYNINGNADNYYVVPLHLKPEQVYVLKSEIYIETGMSDRQFLMPFIKYLDNILNASNTSTERLGSLIVASPKNLTSAPTSVVLTDKDKDKMEKEMMKDYGSLSRQKQIMLLPREMSFQSVSMSEMDKLTMDKVKIALLTIADRLQIPCDQIALVSADNSKALSNGSEITASDTLKYKTFERLLQNTVINMCTDLGMQVTYTIYNKNLDNRGTTVTN